MIEQVISNLEADEISEADLDQIAAGTTATASNNPSVLGQKPTFASILMDTGTGRPTIDAASNSLTQHSSALNGLGTIESS